LIALKVHFSFLQINQSKETKMGFNVVVFLSCLLLLPPVTFGSNMERTTLVIDGSRRIAETDENFICATLDWWPPEKCNYDQCPWGYASLINLVYKTTLSLI